MNESSLPIAPSLIDVNMKRLACAGRRPQHLLKSSSKFAIVAFRFFLSRGKKDSAPFCTLVFELNFRQRVDRSQAYGFLFLRRGNEGGGQAFRRRLGPAELPSQPLEGEPDPPSVEGRHLHRDRAPLSLASESQDLFSPRQHHHQQPLRYRRTPGGLGPPQSEKGGADGGEADRRGRGGRLFRLLVGRGGPVQPPDRRALCFAREPLCVAAGRLSRP